MKTVLYIGESYLGYEIKVKKLIEEKLGYNVIYVDLTQFEYNYKNIFEKIYAKIYFLFTKKKYRKEKMIDSLLKEVKKVEHKIDIIFFIRATDRLERFVKYLYSLNKYMIYHQWDSLKKLKDTGKCIKYFNKASTFDRQDAIDNNIKFLPNFYINDKKLDENKLEYDLFTIISHGKNGKRIDILEKIALKLKNKGIKYKFLVYTNENNVESKNLTIIKKPISLEENYHFMKKSKIILEIGDNFKQGGLSFRAIDSIGLKKKLVTNYDFIKDYDFYDENNIFVLNSDLEIPDEFFKSEYRILDDSIYIKYSGETWIKEVFSI